MWKYNIKNNVLTFKRNFNEPLIGYYKIMSNPKIDTIIFGSNFNHEIEYLIPNNIKIINFKNSAFNKNVNFLSENIEELSFNTKKNLTFAELKNLPISLKKLWLNNINQTRSSFYLPPNF